MTSMKKSIEMKLLVAVTVFVLLIEVVLAVISYQGRTMQLESIRDQIYERCQAQEIVVAEDLMSQAQIRAEVHRYMRNIGFMVILIVLVVAGGTFWITRQIVVAPLLRLIAHIRHNSLSGKLTPLEARSNDEMGFLIQSYNELQENQERFNAMRKSFVAMVVHDMRNPIGSISGNLELAGFYLKSDNHEQLRNSLDTARGQTTRLVSMVNQFLDLSRSEQTAMELKQLDVDPIEFVQEIGLLFTPVAAGQGVRVKLDLAEDLPTLKLDREKIQRVVENLLSNALRHSPQGGVITLACAKEDAMLSISVRDQGPGIQEKDLPRIFDRYYVGKGSLQGYGLGLAFCMLVISGHHGDISARNPEGGGALFRIELPIKGVPAGVADKKGSLI